MPAPTPPKPTFAQSVLQWQEYFEHDECLKTSLGKRLAGFFYALALQADRKQQDYGSENLTDFGARGIVIRMVDKINRLRNLYFERKAAHPESVLDTWGDWLTYEAIGWLMEAKLWPEGRGPVPNEPVLEQGPDSDFTSGERAAGMDLLKETWAIAANMHRQYRGEGALPVPGARYCNPKMPAVVECVTVVASCYDPSTVHLHVLYRYLYEPSSVPTLPTHLCCEPLDYFLAKFHLDER